MGRTRGIRTRLARRIQGAEELARRRRVPDHTVGQHPEVSARGAVPVSAGGPGAQSTSSRPARGARPEPFGRGSSAAGRQRRPEGVVDRPSGFRVEGRASPPPVRIYDLLADAASWRRWAKPLVSYSEL